MELNHLSDTSTDNHRLNWVLVVVSALIIMAYLFFPPLAPLGKAGLIGYSICHQIPDRSFHLGGVQLPLCARCTGTYLGVAVAFAMLALTRRWRVGEMLPTGMVLLLVSFIVTMGIDGLNSYLSLFEGFPTLYLPRNWLRAVTGSLNGIALSMIVFPVFNYTLWRLPQRARPLKNLWELLGILVVDAALIFLVQLEPGWLLYPVALISTAGVLFMLTLVNTMILLLLLRQDRQAERWQDIVAPMSAGLGSAVLELALMATMRYLLTGTMGWPLLS